MGSVLGEDKVGEISKDPVVLECPIDDPEKLAGGGDDCLASAFSCFDPFVELVQITTVLLRYQGALNQGCASQFRSAFGDPSVLDGFVRVTDSRHNPKVTKQLVIAFKVIDLANHAQQNRCRAGADPFDADQIAMSL